MSVRSSWLSDTAFPPYGGASTGENVRNHLAQPMARIDRTFSHNLGSNQLMMFATMHEGGGPKHRKSTPTPAPIFTSRAAPPTTEPGHTRHEPVCGYHTVSSAASCGDLGRIGS
jgi:hypothetical protein